MDCEIAVCCMYCPPGCKVTDISNKIASIKHRSVLNIIWLLEVIITLILLKVTITLIY